MTKRVIMFNGPPGVGKDYAATIAGQWIKNNTNLSVNAQAKMAKPLKDAVHALFGLFHSPAYYDAEGRADKERPHPLLFGMSPRQAYIKLSEEMVKPVMGGDIFGRIQANIIHNSKEQVHVFSDGGFVDEWKPVIEYLGPSNFMCVEIKSPTHTFAGDSRGYVGDALKELYPEITLTKLPNTHSTDPLDKEVFVMLVRGVVKKFIGV